MKMMLGIVHKVTLWLLLSFMLCSGEQTKLELIIVIHRHGQRSPLHMYKSDPNSAKMWPQGLGELTKQGKNGEYELGLFLKNRYANFLKDYYHVDDAYFRSTDTSRTLMSAQLVAAALYPAKGKQIWNNISGLYAWQPIPVSAVAVNNDILLKPNKADCPRAELEMKQYAGSNQCAKFKQKYSALFRNLTKFCGQPVTYTNFTHVYDAIINEKLHGMRQPSWVKMIWPTLQKCRDELSMQRTPTFQLKRLYGGSMLKAIIQNCRDKIEGTSLRQLYDYSTHDKTISILMSTLDIHNGKIPPYSSAIIFELRSSNSSIQASNMNYQLRILFHNDTNINPYELMIQRCRQKTCSFQEFVDVTKELIPDNFEDVCKVQKSTATANYLQSSLLALLLVIHFC